jgi:Cys-rich protein (TIGR01571 family)
MVRMRLNCFGSPDGVAAVATTFRHLLGLSLSYFVIDRILIFIISVFKSGVIHDDYMQYTVSSYPDTYSDSVEAVICEYIRLVLRYLRWAFMSIIIIRTRQAVRAKYIIPQQCCCEDAVCAICCGCCTIMQMSRHTADYEKYEAPCYTETGIPSNIDATV